MGIAIIFMAASIISIFVALISIVGKDPKVFAFGMGVGLLFFVSGVSVSDVTEKNDSSWCEDNSGQFGASAGSIIAGKANEYDSRCRP